MLSAVEPMVPQQTVHIMKNTEVQQRTCSSQHHTGKRMLQQHYRALDVASNYSLLVLIHACVRMSVSCT